MGTGRRRGDQSAWCRKIPDTYGVGPSQDLGCSAPHPVGGHRCTEAEGSRGSGGLLEPHVRPIAQGHPPCWTPVHLPGVATECGVLLGAIALPLLGTGPPEGSPWLPLARPAGLPLVFPKAGPLPVSWSALRAQRTLIWHSTQTAVQVWGMGSRVGSLTWSLPGASGEKGSARSSMGKEPASSA